MNETERRDVITRLTAYRDRLGVLMDLIGNKTHLAPDERVKAQEQMKSLKESLSEDYRYGSSAKGREEMNECERAYFYPAVHEAFTEVKSRWNSDPIRSNWFSELYAAQMDINHLLRQLERTAGEA